MQSLNLIIMQNSDYWYGATIFSVINISLRWQLSEQKLSSDVKHCNWQNKTNMLLYIQMNQWIKESKPWVEEHINSNKHIAIYVDHNLPSIELYDSLLRFAYILQQYIQAESDPA